jgi:hypothetical protein
LKILLAEQGVKNQGLITAFDRGQVYHYLDGKKTAGHTKEAWFDDVIKTPYRTAERYMSFARLVMKYPRLLLCDCSFDVFMHNFKGITTYIKQDHNFALSLKANLNLYVQNKSFNSSCTFTSACKNISTYIH